MDIALQLLSNVIIPGSMFALIAAGFSLVYSVTRVLHLAHGGVVVLAGYVFYGAVAYHWPTPLAVVAALAAATATGLLLHALVYERLRAGTGISSAGSLAATISLLLILQYSILAVAGADLKSLGRFTGGIHSLGPVIYTDHELKAVLLCALLLALLVLFLKRTRTGVAMRAVSEHATVAEVVGISSRRMRMLSMAVGSLLGGVAGILFAIEYSLEPAMATMVAVRMFFRGILGGIGSIAGATLGSLVIEVVTALTSWFWSATWLDFTAFFVTFLVLFFRPNGLLGLSRRKM